ncbi:unnamed protein product [Hyaloperonospora brassicae]|uniref:WRKY19-like zinc finger domain-containing protein n=1 Tax=Hyaloperonospora brassicae TaxID=162125 RepID=A0AAV0SXJ2_HYABA|nr:unnamed protein product [Hyaloperonospora brassicae]
MDTAIAPQLSSCVFLWERLPLVPSTIVSSSKSSLVRLPSLSSMTTVSTARSDPTSTVGSSPQFVALNDIVSPPNELGLARLPAISFMVNRDASPKSNYSPVNKESTDLWKQYHDTTNAWLQLPEQPHHNVRADATCRQQPMPTIALSPDCSNTCDRAKRTAAAKLCGKTDCNKRAKAGGFCISHGGGLRCINAHCTKHALSLGLCIRHGGGKRCTVEGCYNASRKAGVCWSHGGKRQCKVEGCNKGPKTGGYCWRHGSKMKNKAAAV